MEGDPPNLVPLRDPVDVIIMNRLQSDDHTPLNLGPYEAPTVAPTPPLRPYHIHFESAAFWFQIRGLPSSN